MDIFNGIELAAEIIGMAYIGFLTLCLAGFTLGFVIGHDTVDGGVKKVFRWLRREE